MEPTGKEEESETKKDLDTIGERCPGQSALETVVDGLSSRGGKGLIKMVCGFGATTVTTQMDR